MLCVFAQSTGVLAAAQPKDLPQYGITITIDTASHRAQLRQSVTWINTTTKPTSELVFNFYPNYSVPDGEYLKFAKTLELLRLQPTHGIDRNGKFGAVNSVHQLGADNRKLPLTHNFDPANITALHILLPQPVAPGESVTVELDCTYILPNTQGRLGHWQGVTYLTNSLPMLAYYDDRGWRPMPFVPWHQPWCNEAGIFTATIDLPENELLACPAQTKCESRPVPGWKRIETEPFIGRDFAMLCSARYQEFKAETKLPDGRSVALRCLAFPEHEFYATELLKIVGEAIPVYSEWFGAFPYPQFTVVESYFGWNGNECAGLIMIDERVFGMPHLARGYVEYLASHETCHQWWYNYVGTNGYSEPFMDEGAASYFTHRLIDLKRGTNNPFLEWPDGLKWLPNINRENYRLGGMYHSIRNNEMQPAAQDLPQYGHLFGLFTGAYDRGSKAFGMIEQQIGSAAFLDFTRIIVAKYGWRVLHAQDYKRELEEYTGRDWTEFFDRWIYGKGLTDWEIEKVTIEDPIPVTMRHVPITGPVAKKTTSVLLKQTREYTEPTTLGIRFAGQDGFPIRVPINMGMGKYQIAIDQPGVPAERAMNVVVEPVSENAVRVTFDDYAEPEQLEVDPDRVLLDADPNNNRWKSDCRWRVTPLYTALDDADLTTDYDRWNFIVGPWVWGASYSDPWYTRSTMLGLRAGAYRTQKFRGGAYAAYRTNYRDIVLGADAVYLGEKSETGVNWEVRVAGPYGTANGGSSAPQRASAFHRWILKESSSLYLPPMVYHEGFASYQDNFLPFANTPTPGAVRWDRSFLAGWHFRANLYTPYWNPESGAWFDFVAAGGTVEMPTWRETAEVRAEIAGVRRLPDTLGPLRHVRIAGRLVGMGALPDQGQFYALGGGNLFRGYDLSERQGSALWVANAEVRVPLAENVTWDCLDHTLGARGLWLAGFYDVGGVYANGQTVGGNVAHALGAGVRVDVAVFSFIERATLRFDTAKTVSDNTPFQFWFGLQHAF